MLKIETFDERRNGVHLEAQKNPPKQCKMQSFRGIFSWDNFPGKVIFLFRLSCGLHSQSH